MKNFDKRRPAMFLIFSGLAILSMTSVSDSQTDSSVYYIEMAYQNGSLSLENLFVRSSEWPHEYVGDSNYKYEMLTADGKNIYSSRFGFVTLQSLGCHGTCESGLESVRMTLIAPYLEDVVEVRILDPLNETLLSVDVSAFANQREEAVDPVVIVAVAATSVIAVAVFIILANKKPKDPFDKLKRKWSR